MNDSLIDSVIDSMINLKPGFHITVREPATACVDHRHLENLYGNTN